MRDVAAVGRGDAVHGSGELRVGIREAQRGADVGDEAGNIGGAPFAELGVALAAGEDVGRPALAFLAGVGLEARAGGRGIAAQGVGQADVVEVEAVEARIIPRDFLDDGEQQRAVGVVVGAEPRARGAGVGHLQAAFFLHARHELGRCAVEFAQHHPDMVLEALGMRGGEAGGDLVAVEPQGGGRGQELGGIVRAAAPDDVREDGGDAVGGEEIRGERPVAGNVAGAVVVPDADEFAGARRLDGGVGAQQELALAPGQQQGLLGLAAGEGGLDLRGEHGGLVEQGADVAGPRGERQMAGDARQRAGEAGVVVDAAGVLQGADGGGRPQRGIEPRAQRYEQILLRGQVVALQDVRHPEAARRSDEGGFGLADVAGVVPSCDNLRAGAGGERGHEAGGILPDARRDQPAHRVGEDDGPPAAGAIGLDIRSEPEAQRGGQRGRRAVEHAQLAAAGDEIGQRLELRGRGIGIVGQQGDARVLQRALGQVVVGHERVAEAGFDQQVADARGGFFGDGARAGVGARRRAAHDDERRAFDRGEAAEDQRDVRGAGAFPRRKADAVDAVPAGGLPFGREVALVEHEGVQRRAGEGFVGDVPARAALEVQPERAQGVGRGTGDVQLEGDGGGEVEVDRLVPRRAVGVPGKGRGEGEAVGGGDDRGGFQVGRPRAGRAGREILD